MRTIRTLTENYIYDNISYYLQKVAEGGSDAVIDGVPVMLDAFVRGHLIRASADLYMHYRKNEDPKAGDALTLFRIFISYLDGYHCGSWGKLHILRTLTALRRAGLTPEFSEKELSLLQAATEYDDFYDRETGLLRDNLPSNYYQVAMSCAGYRSYLGWEDDTVFNTVSAKLFQNMQEFSQSGYLDEDPPHGRFDRYTIVMSSEIADSLIDYEKPVPGFVLANLRNAAELCLFMANKKGDGINYGRSLSVHGDSACEEILSTAAACGLLKEEEKALAVAYSAAIIEKLTTYWHRDEMKGFDIFTNGRTSNQYRNIGRRVELNLDMCEHMLASLRNFERAGMADLEITDCIPSPKAWKYKEILWNDTEVARHETIILRREDDLVMLPLIGLGTLHKNAAYMPFPALNRKLEGPPEAVYPFLVPEYVDRLNLVCRPTQFFREISIFPEKDRITIIVTGRMAKYHPEQHRPTKTEHVFKTVYMFDANTVTVMFETDIKDGKDVTMFAGSSDPELQIRPFGFDYIDPVLTHGAARFDTPHGALQNVVKLTGSANKTVGYMVTL